MNNRLHSCETELLVPIFKYLKDPTGRRLLTRAYVEPDPQKRLLTDRLIQKTIDDYQLETLFKAESEDLKNLIRN